MQSKDESFFENLAKGNRSDAEQDETEMETTETAEAETAAAEFETETGTASETGATEADAGANDMGSYHVELAKAETAAVAERSSKATRGKAQHWEDDGTEGQLTVDVYQTPNEIVIESAIAGVKPEDIDINVTTDSISIKGERRREEAVSNEDYLYQECYWGRFSRAVILPQEVDPENASVSFRNGILTVRLPKVHKAKAKKLKVKFD